MEIRKQTMVRQRDDEREEGENRGCSCGGEFEEGCCGSLPSCAPLANPYVPFQPDNPPTYPAKTGVVRGTLFPGLDLPFMGMVNESPLSDTQLHELQTLGFALVELGEYLDTHADDQEAFEMFRSYAELYKKGRAEYEKTHGPLTQAAAANADRYRWLCEPWPWEYEANQTREA